MEPTNRNTIRFLFERVYHFILFLLYAPLAALFLKISFLDRIASRAQDEVQPRRLTNQVVRDNAASEIVAEENLQIVVAPPNYQQMPEKERHVSLYRAAIVGDWKIAENIFKDHPSDITAQISVKKNNALHIAAAAKSCEFAKKLVEKMDKEDLAKKNDDNNTAFCLVAASGQVELAKAMMMRNSDLAKKPGSNNLFPVQMAALFGHEEMVKFLYHATGDPFLNESERLGFLMTLIDTGLYDSALDLVKKYPKLATAQNENKETALHASARMPNMLSTSANQNQPGISRSCFDRLWMKLKNFNLFSDDNKHRNIRKLRPEAIDLIRRLWKEVITLDASEIKKIVGGSQSGNKPLISIAVEQGNIEFLSILIQQYPDLILKADEEFYSIFHHAVLNRQNKIFNLINEVRSIKDFIVPYKDSKGNNILHLAGMPAPPDRLNIVSGAALQLQHELLWFKQVEKIVFPLDAEAKNDDGKTPKALFTENHKELKDKGEKWMKGTANSCLIVATLIATVVFAAAFTVPGGTKEETGTPHFLHKVSFKIFVIADAASLVLSSCSILNFLSILTSRYKEEDFLLVLPKKLFYGLATLLLSIAAMMVVFCATIFILFEDGVLWLPIFVAVLASVPGFLFFKQQRRLLFDVFLSICRNNSLFKPMKPMLFLSEGQGMESKKRK